MFKQSLFVSYTHEVGRSMRLHCVYMYVVVILVVVLHVSFCRRRARRGKKAKRRRT